MAHARHPHPIRIQANRSCLSHGSPSSFWRNGMLTQTRANVPPMKAPTSGEKFPTAKGPSPPRWKPKKEIIRMPIPTIDPKTIRECERMKHLLNENTSITGTNSSNVSDNQDDFPPEDRKHHKRRLRREKNRSSSIECSYNTIQCSVYKGSVNKMYVTINFVEIT